MVSASLSWTQFIRYSSLIYPLCILLIASTNFSLFFTNLSRLALLIILAFLLISNNLKKINYYAVDISDFDAFR